MNIKEALELIGGLSNPSKMPCFSYSIPAQKCITGMKLRNVPNSICSKCYALKGMYGFPVVKAALEKRFVSLSNPSWTDAMVSVILAKEKSGFFRWHDSGDLQSVEHLAKICQVAFRLPQIKFWLPTREFSIVSEYLKNNWLPDNLTVRLSALMIGEQPPVSIASRLGLTTSSVSKTDFNCPASNQWGKCLECRACWDKSVSNVSYKQH